MDEQKTSGRERFPKVEYLVNRAGGQLDGNLGPRTVKMGGRTSGPRKIWPTGYPHRLTRQTRTRKPQHQSC